MFSVCLQNADDDNKGKKFFNFRNCKPPPVAMLLWEVFMSDILFTWLSLYVSLTWGFGFKLELDELTKCRFCVIELFIPLCLSNTPCYILQKRLSIKAPGANLRWIKQNHKTHWCDTFDNPTKRSLRFIKRHFNLQMSIQNLHKHKNHNPRIFFSPFKEEQHCDRKKIIF